MAASRENVNRALSPLVATGVISQRDGRFVVHDLGALERGGRCVQEDHATGDLARGQPIATVDVLEALVGAL